MTLLLALWTALLPQVTYPARPAQGEFILDEAKLLADADAAEIRNVCGQTFSQKQVPIVVVTIRSLGQYGASGWPIHTYARHLFAQWSVGRAEWNYGMLLLVSSGDKKARIELGASWGHLKDQDAQKVMTEEAVPRFKQGELSAGILAGVRGLREIALSEIQGEPVPQVYGPAPTRSPAPVAPPPFQRVRTTTLPDVSGASSVGGCLMIVLGALVVAAVVIGIVTMVKSMGTTSWAGSPGGASPGCSAFAGGCLGSGLGSWFGGSGYSRYGYYDDPWDRPWGWGHGWGWFGGGSTRVDHYYHTDSGAGSGSSSGSSSDDGGSWGSGDGGSGGGFSGGGGASGEW